MSLGPSEPLLDALDRVFFDRFDIRAWGQSTSEGSTISRGVKSPPCREAVLIYLALSHLKVWYRADADAPALRAYRRPRYPCLSGAKTQNAVHRTTAAHLVGSGGRTQRIDRGIRAIGTKPMSQEAVQSTTYLWVPGHPEAKVIEAPVRWIVAVPFRRARRECAVVDAPASQDPPNS